MIRRFQESRLSELLSLFPVVAVVGPRQVGKSTLVTQEFIANGRLYRTLDDITIRSVAERDPKSFLDESQPLTIDEVQLVPSLLREIKLGVDRDRRPGRYLLTGSADLDHCADLSHVLAGRVGILQLPPISRSEETGTRRWHEWLAAADPDELDAAFAGAISRPFEIRRLLTGGFPLSLRAESDRERGLWMESFRMTYLERDLRRISDIGNLADFNRLMQLAAVQTGTLVNQASMARDAGLSPATAGRYLALLEASLLIQRLPPYFVNIGKRLVKSPKLFWADTGLCAFLMGINKLADLESEPQLRGRLFETFVMVEVRSLLPFIGEQTKLFHLRTHDQLEVDGLIEVGRRIVLFEIKSSQTVTAADAAPLEKWMALHQRRGTAVVLYAGSEYQRLSRSVRAIPVSMLFG